MHFKARIVVAGAFAVSPLLFYSMNHQRSVLAAQPNMPVMATRLYTGPDGLTHIDEIELKLTATPGFTPEAGSKAITELSEPAHATKAFVVRSGTGSFEDWHNADARRYVATLSGRAEIDASDGQKTYAEPGRILLAEDLTGKGHTFRVVSKDPYVALFVDLAP
ncbi:MAG: hypothetical protein WA634_16215 [Silvibacterium sp.]